MAAPLANVRDASLLGNPRHDGVGGHRPGAWGPKWHVVIDHPIKGGSWSACGKTFLIAGGMPAAEVARGQRCGLNGCRQRFAQADDARLEGER
jgi:hypothetical protein